MSLFSDGIGSKATRGERRAIRRPVRNWKDAGIGGGDTRTSAFPAAIIEQAPGQLRRERPWKLQVTFFQLLEERAAGPWHSHFGH
jgi:hypothetical protein